MDSETVTNTPSRTRQAIVAVIKLVVSVGLLAILFSRTDLHGIWLHIRTASIPWLLVAIAFYLAQMLVATWRWGQLLRAQGIELPTSFLLGSYLIAGFFNNFLPSNIGGDVIRIRDTAGPSGSKTLATTVVLIDRVIGLMGLVFVAAVGASAAMGGPGASAVPIWPSWLWATLAIGTIVSIPAVVAPAGVGRLLQPLTVFHPEWVGGRITQVTDALGRFRERPVSLMNGVGGAIAVQAMLVAFYAGIARSLGIPISIWHVAVVVPVSFVVQMLPLSVNGFGVREATFSLYFKRLGLPIESAMALSLGAQALIILFSLSGAGVYVARRPKRQ